MDDNGSHDSFEARPRPRDPDPGRLATIVFGLIVLAIGLWFFADRTLGLDMPQVNLGALWPLLLVALGVWILLGAGRRTRS